MRESINTSLSWIQGNASAIGLIRPIGRSLHVSEAEEATKDNE